MGLDALDLVFRLEKRLGIKIPADEFFAVFITPRKLHDYLMAKLNGNLGGIPSLAPLYKEVNTAVNRTVSWLWGNPTRDLNKRFSASHRQACWNSLENELRISLPKLVQSPQELELRIPRECDSVLSLTNWIADNYPDRVEWMPVDCKRSGKMADRTWTENEVWEILRECIVDALGVKPEEVTPDARLAEDLGMG
jgi:acyl carrier protein